ncbi:MAG TPA: hypothetical protein DEH78_03275 [Solibacterales bacterium]|nr:hypothetical protein [Bryobacterales bacterium]
MLFRALAAVLALAAAGTGFIAWRQFRAAESAAQAAAKAQTEATELRQLLDRANQRRQDAGEPPIAAPGREPAHRPSSSPVDHAARLESIRLLGQTRDQLAASQASVRALEQKVAELEAAAQKAAEDNKRLSDAESELRENLGANQRLVDAIQTELKGKSERLLQLETAMRRGGDEMKALNEKLARATKSNREVEDLNRRREIYLTNLQRRYRDITDQMRAMALRLDNPQERPNQMDLSRIQTALQSAEEDLKQLSNLNAQAARLK